MDNYNIEDELFGIINPVLSDKGFKVYKGPSITGESDNHAVILVNNLHTYSQYNKAPSAYVTLFARLGSSGQRPVIIKEAQRAVEQAITSHSNPKALFDVEIGFISPVKDAKDGFFAVTFNLQIITQK